MLLSVLGLHFRAGDLHYVEDSFTCSWCLVLDAAMAHAVCAAKQTSCCMPWRCCKETGVVHGSMQGQPSGVNLKGPEHMCCSACVLLHASKLVASPVTAFILVADVWLLCLLFVPAGY